MMPPRLVIRKRMQLIQGKVRPCCFAQAMIDPEIKSVIEEHFLTESLFRRASYSVNWPKGAIEIPPALAPALSTFLKNDACPEITVKTLVAGQLHQAGNVWEMMCFELLAKLAFDNLLAIVATAADLNRDLIFTGTNRQSDIASFNDDMAADSRPAATAGIAA